MADLYSVITGLTPSQQDILEAELLATQILSAQYPTLDLRVGTGLRDLLIRPAALLLAQVKAALEYTQLNIADVNDQTPTDMVDDMMSNWFLTRNLGLSSVINARLYFARAKNVVISSSVYFSPDNSLKYYPSTTMSFGSNALTLDPSSNEYYVDIDLTAEQQGSAYDISTGSLLYFSNFDPYFLHAEINYLKTTSIPEETNTAFIKRGQTAISTRNLINNPSIIQNLTSNFNFLDRVVPIGMGDPEMVRDLLLAALPSQPAVNVINMLQSLSVQGNAYICTTNVAHGMSAGQSVVLTNASPSYFNGTFSVVSVTTNTFIIVNPLGVGLPFVYPTATPTIAPIYVHTGGMVDVYCGDILANSVIQVTLDALGKAQVTGPIYSLVRSVISGGSSPDTVPLNTVANINNTTFSGNTINVYYTSTNTGANFIMGDAITLSGYQQNQPISSISANNGQVSVVVPTHNFEVGDQVVIANVNPSAYNGTFTINSVPNANNFTYQSSSVTLGSGTAVAGQTMTASVNVLNGTFTPIAAVNDMFTINLGRVTTFPTTGAAQASALYDFKVYNTYTQSSSVNLITWFNGVATVSQPGHGLAAGQMVTLSGNSVPQYNGTFRVDSIITGDQYTILIPSSTPLPTSSSGGSNSAVIPWNDYGFSQLQSLTVDFGPSNANKTASLVMNYFDNLDGIQSYLDQSSNRVLCGNLLARGFNIYLLDITVNSYNTTAPDSSLVTALINSYVESLNPGDTFVVSDMISKLRVNGVINIQNPPSINFTRYTRDLTPPTTGSIKDLLDPDDRTSVFLLRNLTTGSVSVATSTPTIA